MKNIFLHPLINTLIFLGFSFLVVIGMTGLCHHSIFSDQALLELSGDFQDLVNFIIVPQIDFIKKLMVITIGYEFEGSRICMAIYGLGLISIGITGILLLRIYERNHEK